MASKFIAPPFGPAKAVVLSDLSTREKEDWYELLLSENVTFTKDQLNEDAPARYIANVRVVAPNIPSERAGPPEFTRRKSSPRRPQESLMRQISRALASAEAGEEHAELIVKFAREAVDLSAYKRIISLMIESGPENAKPRLLSWIMKLVEDIYDARYIHDTADLQTTDGDISETQIHERISNIFPVFVMDHLSKKYGLRSLVEQNCWELVLNSAVYRREVLAIEIFSRFLQEKYDPDDLLFFLYVRSVIQKVLNFSFKTRWVDSKNNRNQQPQDLWLSYRECVQIAKTVFGSDQDPMCREFLQIVESQLVGRRRAEPNGQDTRRIEVNQFLLLAVSGYHEARPDNEPDPFDASGRDLPLHKMFLLNNRQLGVVSMICQSPSPRVLVEKDDNINPYNAPEPLHNQDNNNNNNHRYSSGVLVDEPKITYDDGSGTTNNSGNSIRLDEYLEAIAKDRIALEEMERRLGQLRQNSQEEVLAPEDTAAPPVAKEEPEGQDQPKGEEEEEAGYDVIQMQESLTTAYVNELMSGVGGLHEDIVTEIKTQIRSQLSEKVGSKLLALGPLEPQAVMGQLQTIFQDPNLKAEIETLLELLVTYATNRVQTTVPPGAT